jgi:acyl dehydratase
MAINRALVGKTYEQQPFEITAPRVKQFLDATDAADLDAYRSERTLAPPMFAAVYTFPVVASVILDPELRANPLRVMQRDQDMEFLAPLFVGDVVSTRGTLERIEERELGDYVVLRLETARADGTPAFVGRFAAYVLKKRDPNDPRPRPAPQAEPSRSDPPLFRAVQRVTADHPTRYAEASGDIHPNHLDEAAARKAGNPGIILHGSCTISFAHNALVRHVCNEPYDVKRFVVEMSTTVSPGDELTIEGWRQNGSIALAIRNQNGVEVFRNSRAEISGQQAG